MQPFSLAALLDRGRFSPRPFWSYTPPFRHNQRSKKHSFYYI